ncbi:hypothetical protein FXO38_12932 [Capsicum annuum]|nr:hypothetical protein FXO38_12932 [Capsicum annuum]
MCSFAKYAITSLEKMHKPQLYVEPDLGIPLDLLDLSVYNPPKGVKIPLAPEDEELLRDDEPITPIKKDGIKKKERPTDKGVSWLVKTQYISPLSTESAKQSLTEKQAKELRENRGGRNILENLNNRDRQIQEIKASFEACKLRPIHATNHRLRPVKVQPLFPDFDRLKIDEVNLRWVCEALKEASLIKGNSCRRWGRKIQVCTFRVFQNFNIHGRFVRVESLLGNKKLAVMIPEVSYNSGLGNIAGKILRFLGKDGKLLRDLKVTPISHNQFLFDFPSRQEANRVKAGEWFWNGRKLSLRWWSPVSGSEMISQRKEQRWIKAFGIPLHSWTLETFRTFGDRCGGFIDVDEDTKNKTHLYWACICVNNHTINTPATLDLVVGEWNYEVSILEDHHTKPRPIQEKLSDKSTAGAERPKKEGPLQRVKSNKGKDLLEDGGPQAPTQVPTGLKLSDEIALSTTLSPQATPPPPPPPPPLSSIIQEGSHAEANDEANPVTNFKQLLHQPIFRQELSLVQCSDFDFSSPSLSETPQLPWYREGSNPQIVQEPVVIETSKWTKLTMVKACKAYGVKANGFEHELLDMIIRMEQRRQFQLQQKNCDRNSVKESKNKGEGERKRLICGINYDRKAREGNSTRERHQRSFSG